MLFYSSSNVIVILLKTFNDVILIFIKAYNYFQSIKAKWEKSYGHSDSSKKSKSDIVPREINEGHEQISDSEIKEQAKIKRQAEIFNKIIEKQNEKLKNIDLSN